MRAEDYELNNTMNAEEEYSEEESLLGLFEGHYEPTPKICFSMVNKAIAYNEQINLYETVRTNENFFIGRVCLPM